MLLVFAALLLGVANPWSFSAHRTTTTVTAETLSIELYLAERRKTSWNLPAGQYSLLGAPSDPACEASGFDFICKLPGNTRLEVKGPAFVKLQISPTGAWLISVAGVRGSAVDASVYGVSNAVLLQADQSLGYQSESAPESVRLPIVADGVVIGSDLHESATIEDTSYDFWQPILLSGGVQVIASNSPGREKYEVLHERLDAGDVVHVGTAPGEPVSDRRSVWGLLTLNSPGGSSASRTLQAVLHTSVRELSVTRFGAPEGHLIKAARWSILAKWPNGQAAWILFVSAVVFFTFVFELASLLDRARGRA